MHDEHPHPLLAQVPLTVSPFLHLPTATPLPYTYKQLPSTLPPSILSANATADASSSQNPQGQQGQQQQPPAYVVSSSGTSAHPDAILSSCLALQAHLQSLEAEAKKTLGAWEEKRRAEELAEKRRVAPGWLDGDVKLLRPENVSTEDTAMEDVEASGSGQQGAQAGERRSSVGIRGLVERRDGIPNPSEGEALDRAFGGLDLK